LTDFTDAPILIQTGECDTYDETDSCTRLVQSLPAAVREHVSATVYPGATHAFDRLEPGRTINDPYSHLGQGGDVRIEPDPQAAAAARQATVDFFHSTFVRIAATDG
jgi:dienelactone hydrolase